MLQMMTDIIAKVEIAFTQPAGRLPGNCFSQICKLKQQKVESVIKIELGHYSETLKMTNFGTGHLKKIVIFKLVLKPSFARSFGHLGIFARSNSLNANRHLARFVTFEVVICEVLLYMGPPL